LSLYFFGLFSKWLATRSLKGELSPLRSPNCAGYASMFISDIIYLFDDFDH
jgi:hypothetical protein